jgi:hypothetical protein
MPAQLQSHDFRSAAARPFFWLNVAKDLRNGAEVLWRADLQTWVDDQTFVEQKLKKQPVTVPPARGTWRPAFMLLGLATENAIKGITVCDDPPKLCKGKIDWIGNGHDQQLLVTKTSLKLRPRQLKLLRKLSDFVEWAGRYPLPRKATAANDSVAVTPQEWQASSDLYQLLESELTNRELSGQYWNRELIEEAPKKSPGGRSAPR